MVEQMGQTFDEAAEDLARGLTELKLNTNQEADARSWEMATLYVTSFEKLAELYEEEYLERATAHKINKKVRSFEWYEGWGTSQLSNAKRTYEEFEDIFMVDHKKLPYDFYMRIANCSLSEPRAKQYLREWAEDIQPTQKELRECIREAVDQEKGIYKPDFDLKVGNMWRFNSKTNPDEFDGGIHPELVANLLYYFTDPYDVIVDPMAGGDTTYKVLHHYKFFETTNTNLDFSGPREIHRCDIDPQHRDIQQADIRKELPFPDEFADFCILDPPYHKIAEGKYDAFGETIEEWRKNLTLAIGHIKRILKHSGMVAIIAEDFLRSNGFQPLAHYAFTTCMEMDLIPGATIYNSNPHFVVSMGPLEMWRAKQSRTTVNQMKIVNVFEKR